MSKTPDVNAGFEHVEAWVFDLDNTLYPADCNLFAEIDTRMGAFIAERFGVSPEEAQRMRKHYYYTYGTTLAGLMRLHDVPPDLFLDYVHDIDLSVVMPAPELGLALDALPGRKFVFTNGSRQHAEKVIARLGLDGRFEDVFDIHAAAFVPKPERAAYERFMGHHGVAGVKRCDVRRPAAQSRHGARGRHDHGARRLRPHRSSRARRHRRLERAAVAYPSHAPMRWRRFLAGIAAARADGRRARRRGAAALRSSV